MTEDSIREALSAAILFRERAKAVLADEASLLSAKVGLDLSQYYTGGYCYVN